MMAVALLALPLALTCLALLAIKPVAAPFAVVGVGGFAVFYRFPEWALLMMGVLVPFEGAFEGSSITGAKLVGVALIAIIALRFVLRQIPPANWRSPLWPWLIAFMSWYMLSLWKSDYRLLSISNLKDLLVGMVLFLAVLLVGRKMSLVAFARLVAVGVAATCLIAFAKHGEQVQGRAIGLMSDPNYFALLCVVALPMAALAMIRSRHLIPMLFWAGIMVLVLGGVVVSGSRSGLVVTLLLCLMGLWHHRQRLSAFRPKHMGFALLGLLLMLPVAYKAMPDQYLAHMETLLLLQKGVNAVQDPSLGRRTSYLVIGTQLVKAHPWLGTGPGTFPVHYATSQYAAAFSFEPDRSDLFRPAHNTYMQLLAETGLPGGLLFIALVGTALWLCLRARQHFLRAKEQHQADIAAHYGLSLMGMAFFLMFLTIPNHKYLWMLLALASCIHQSSLMAKRPQPAVGPAS